MHGVTDGHSKCCQRVRVSYCGDGGTAVHDLFYLAIHHPSDQEEIVRGECYFGGTH